MKKIIQLITGVEDQWDDHSLYALTEDGKVYRRVLRRVEKDTEIHTDKDWVEYRRKHIASREEIPETETFFTIKL